MYCHGPLILTVENIFPIVMTSKEKAASPNKHASFFVIVGRCVYYAGWSSWDGLLIASYLVVSLRSDSLLSFFVFVGAFLFRHLLCLTIH